MNQESIYDFVKIPGIIGVALVQEQVELYFYVKEQALDEKEKQSITQQLLQFIAQIPKQTDYHTFQFRNYYVYNYKLNSSISFLVLTNADINTNQLRALAAKQLKDTIQRDIDNALIIFKHLANISNQVDVSMGELLNALNSLSRFTKNYIGPQITANYWHLARPQCEWLEKFQINRSGEITFSGSHAETMSDLQYQWLKEWAATFIKQCSQIIKDFSNMVEQKGLNDRNQKLLLNPKATQAK